MPGIRSILLSALWFLGTLGLWGQETSDTKLSSGHRSQITDHSSLVTCQLSLYPSPGYNNVYQPGMNGFGLGLDFNWGGYKAVALAAGLEYRASDWCNQLLVSAGVGHPWIDKSRWHLETQVRVINGLALYRPASLYIIGGETLARIHYRIGKRMGLSIHAGARWTTCPGYGRYGLITSYFELPWGIGVIFGN